MPWKIWIKYYDDKGDLTGQGYYYQSYIRKGNAERAARRRYSDDKQFEYVVSQTNPW